VPAAEEKILEWYRYSRPGVGLVTGFGDLVALDFDRPGVCEEFKEQAAALGCGELLERVESGYLERTPKGGAHVLYRCESGRGNTKLAQRVNPETGKPETVIETRGVGGFVIVAPSNGAVHPSGGAYVLIRGGVDSIVRISVEDEERLWEVARSLDEVAAASTEPERWEREVHKSIGDGCRWAKLPGVDFGERTTWAEILEPLGWAKSRLAGDVVYWRRPGKEAGVSATEGYCNGLYVFSSNAGPFEANKSYSKFAAYALLSCGGDFRVAAQELASKGFGIRAEKSVEPEVSKPGSGDYAHASAEELGVIMAGNVRERPIEWLWLYRLERGELALVAGDAGGGKTLVVLAIAAVITTGGEWPGGSGFAPRGSVAIVSAEDARESTLKPRLRALGADLSQVAFVTAKFTVRKPDGTLIVSPKSFQDAAYWRAVFDQIPRLRLLVVDPLPSYLGRGVKDEKNTEIRQVLEPFIEDVLRPAGVCMVGVTHLNKNIDMKTPLHRITGSMAYGALPRNVHIVVENPDQPGQRLFKQAKCNNAPRELAAVGFEVEKAMVESASGEIETVLAKFSELPVDVDLREALAGSKSRGPVGVMVPKLAKFLVDFLKGKGPVLLGEIGSAAGEAGLLGSLRADGRWSMFTQLYAAIRLIPGLPAPDDGWVVVTSKEEPELRSVGNKARWVLRELRK
jgi:hypothetical protein